MEKEIVDDISDQGEEYFSLSKVLNSPEVYRLTTPGAHGVSRNSYILRSRGNVLAVDPPLHNPNGYQVFSKALKLLVEGEYSLKVFYTHFHTVDLSKRLAWLPVGTQVFLSGYGPGMEDIKKDLSYQNVRFRKEGYPKDLLKAWGGPKGDRCHWKESSNPDGTCQEDVQTTMVFDGDAICVGEWTCICLYTPGHTLGHMCLALKEKGLLFSGDTVLFDDLPFVGIWKGKKGAVDYLLESLKRLEKENYRIILPSHGICEGNSAERVKEMAHRCYFRILEMYRLVYDHPEENAYQLSRYFCRCSENCHKLSVRKQWYAMGETLAYLIYLRDRKYVSSNRSEHGMVNVPGKRKITDY